MTQTEMFMRFVALRQGTSEMELIFEIVFSRTLIGFRWLYPIGLALLVSHLVQGSWVWSNGDGRLCNRGSVPREHAGLVPELVMLIVHIFRCRLNHLFTSLTNA